MEENKNKISKENYIKLCVELNRTKKALDKSNGVERDKLLFKYNNLILKESESIPSDLRQDSDRHFINRYSLIKNIFLVILFILDIYFLINNFDIKSYITYILFILPILFILSFLYTFKWKKYRLMKNDFLFCRTCKERIEYKDVEFDLKDIEKRVSRIRVKYSTHSLCESDFKNDTYLYIYKVISGMNEDWMVKGYRKKVRRVVKNLLSNPNYFVNNIEEASYLDFSDFEPFEK